MSVLVQIVFSLFPHRCGSNLSGHQHALRVRWDLPFLHTPTTLEVFPAVLASRCQRYGHKKEHNEWL